MRRFFFILFNPIKWLNEPYYIVKGNKVFKPDGREVPQYDGNDPKWFANPQK